MAGCKGRRLCCVVIDDSVYLKFVNEKEEDLLNSNLPHAITMQNTDIYYLVNGKKKRPDVGSDNPKGFHIGHYDTTGDYEMLLYANTPKERNTGITYINFKEYPSDTLKVKYDNSHGIVITKIWYNGKLRRDYTKRHVYHGLSDRVIVVTKHLSAK
jgi:hypothetical protein